jgi:Flp pilus assembly protein TadB
MPNSNHGHYPSSRAGPVHGGKSRFLRICAIIGFVAGVVVIWVFGFNLWTAAAFILLIGCPLVVVWALMIDRQSRSTERRKP